MSPEVVFSPSTMDRKENEKTKNGGRGRETEMSGTEELVEKGHHWSPGGRNLTKRIPTIHCY